MLNNKFSSRDELIKESNRLREEWKIKNNISRLLDGGNQAWADLISGKKYSQKYFITEHSSRIGIFDHSDLYSCKDKSRVFITQPYHIKGNVSPLECRMNDNETVSEWAFNRGLKVDYSFEESWHYPGATVLISFRLVDPKRYVNAIKTRYRYCEIIERF